MLVVDPTAECVSEAWPGATAEISVVVATHQRAGFLGELLAALAGQDLGTDRFEVVIADDGSTDDTWPVLCAAARSMPLALCALRLSAQGGPSVPRNTAAARARAPFVAMTDDDCLPAPGWLTALLDALRSTGSVVQGSTLPADTGRSGPWDRTIAVRRPSGLYETCNLALPRDTFVDLGGFPLLDVLGPTARGFGEDVVLGAAAAGAVGFVWRGDALVRHRWLPGSYRDHLASRRRVSGFPMLLRLRPELRALMWHHWFLTRRTAMTDVALVGCLVALLLGSPAAGVTALPWLVYVARIAWAQRWTRRLPRFAQEAVADVVTLASLVAGSVRQRRLLL